MYTIGNDSCYLVIFIVAWRVIYLPESGIWGEIISHSASAYPLLTISDLDPVLWVSQVGGGKDVRQ